jgi:predicted nuclease of predicted toxin-antitoxin system
VAHLRLLLDQMIGATVAETLRGEGYDVIRVSEVGMARADDAEIMSRATAEDRVLVTLDEHFGDWVVLPLDKHAGVVRLKANPATTERIYGLLSTFLKNHTEARFADRLVIVSHRGIRWIETG